ncbi:MAG: thiol oxidoreductase, partial [Flavobacteriales bacterium]|nr:thiol oxidoreductase [Flavobacteriales bacterium]
GCADCHTSKFVTSRSAAQPEHRFQLIWPYTDLLLHDMGAGLDDAYTEGFATTAEWKTPALWGLGLSQDAQGGSYFLLHDGRARSIEQAIEMHDGEANNSRNLYMQLAEIERSQLIKFLESL